jgi:hypothetical protein
MLWGQKYKISEVLE